MQGRSLPRSNAVYADFAAVIGTTKSGSWITDCSIEEFAAELAACTGVQSELLIRPGAPARRVDLGLRGLFGGITTLAGAFPPTRRPGRRITWNTCIWLVWWVRVGNA